MLLKHIHPRNLLFKFASFLFDFPNTII